MLRQLIRRCALLAVFALSASAHIGSPDIYLDGKAGPYQLFVTIRPPQVIPGVAELEVRCQSPGITKVRAVPLPLSNTGVSFSPVPDALKVSPQDKQFFTGSLWLMADGSSQVRILVDGEQGPGVLSVPVPSIALTTRKMQPQLGLALGLVGLLLTGGLIAIVGASVREAKLASGVTPDSSKIRKSRIAMVVAFVLLAAVLWGGKSWWDSEARTYRDRVYKPLNMSVHLDSSRPAVLTLDLTDPGWMQPARRGVITRILFVRKIDDLVPDHNHIMHLYAIRQPGMDVVYHLHPDLVTPAKFRLALPAMLPGNYKLYADIVHENGLPETLVATLALPEGVSGSTARPLGGDDAAGFAKPVQSAASADAFTLPDGYRMVWVRDTTQAIHARQANLFRFRLLTPDGQPPPDMTLYMGMLGHAAFVKSDGTVFAHIHPNGTAPMAALVLAQQQEGMQSMAGMDHAQMMHQAAMQKEQAGLPNEVSFPYGFPASGQYRIFVQMKHGDTVESGAFDAIVE